MSLQHNIFAYFLVIYLYVSHGTFFQWNLFNILYIIYLFTDLFIVFGGDMDEDQNQDQDFY